MIKNAKSTPMDRAAQLAQKGLAEAIQAEIDNNAAGVHTESDYQAAGRRYREQLKINAAEGRLRGMEHNHELHVNSQIRKHGGYQIDMFAEPQTGKKAA